MKPRLYMIIPCYNEEKVLPITSEMFLEELNLLITKDKISENSCNLTEYLTKRTF